MMNDKYRIRRYNALNMVIEEKRIPDPSHRMTKNTEPTWKILGYYGNSLESLTRGLLDLVARDFEPDESKALNEQLEDLKAHIDEAMKCFQGMEIAND